MPHTYTKADALFSSGDRNRFRLWREWHQPGSPTDGENPLSFTVIGLNPSVAGKQDDPTVRRLVSFAKREGYGRLDLFNLSTIVATDPAAMLADAERESFDTLTHAASGIEVAGLVVFAWGANVLRSKVLWDRAEQLIERAFYVLPDPPLCFGHTKAGYPKHPLYLAASTPLVPFQR